MKLLIVCLLLNNDVTYSANILSIFPIESYSHYRLGLNLITEMARRGHKVTLISPYKLNKPIENIKEIKLDESKYLGDKNIKVILDQPITVYNLETWSTNYNIMNAHGFFQNSEVKSILNSNETFDLVFYDQFSSNIYLALGYHFKCPVVLFVAHASSIYVNYLLGNPNVLSYVPKLGSALTTDMSIFGRIENVWYYISFQYLNQYYSIPKQNEILQKELGPMPYLTELMYDASLVLISSDVSYSQPFPLTAAMKEIGGFHIENTKTLPQDIQEFLDTAKEGVILFSMGSFIKGSIMNESRRNVILETFSKLKQNVLWKYENDIPTKPENLKILKWVPQQDVLAHQNIKLFISPCGLLSYIEAIYHKVPMICMPINFDQYQNSDYAVKHGYAEIVPFTKFTMEQLYSAIKKVISNSSYKENVTKRSKILRDKPISPKDAAIYWLEYVIRNKGASVLRSASLNLYWFQLHMFDVIVIFSLILLLVIILLMQLYFIFKSFLIKNISN